VCTRCSRLTAVSYKIWRLQLSNARFRSSRRRYTEISRKDGSFHFRGTVQSGGVNDRHVDLLRPLVRRVCQSICPLDRV